MKKETVSEKQRRFAEMVGRFCILFTGMDRGEKVKGLDYNAESR